MDNIELTAKLSLDDFVKVSFHMFYRKFAIKTLTGIWIVVALFSLPYLLTNPILETWPNLLFILFLVFGIPVFTYFSVRRNYKLNSRISEKITYNFNDETIATVGETFSAKMTWDKIYSVTENKDWVVIWQNRQIANVLPKRDFQNDDLKIFKEIVKKQKALKNKLKY